MYYLEFLDAVINNGIAAAKEDYKNDKPNHLNGSIAGFEACRNKNPDDLREVWQEAGGYIQKFFGDYDNVDTYWWYRCYQLEVEWVCNVVSAAYYSQGMTPILSWLPTCNGMIAASKIVGVMPQGGNVQECDATGDAQSGEAG